MSGSAAGDSMSKPFEVAEDGALTINEAEILGSQFICSGIGLTLPEDFDRQAQEKADLLERRLSRIEATLGLKPMDAC